MVAALVEGRSIRAPLRRSGVAKATVTKWLVDFRSERADLMDRTMRNLPCERIQIDATRSSCRAKAKVVPEDEHGQFGHGDIGTFTAIDADPTWMPCFLGGRRDAGRATAFGTDRAGRVASRIQPTSDGHARHLSAFEARFGGEVDFARLLEHDERPCDDAARCPPPVGLGGTKRAIQGNPDPDHVSTSFVQRANLSIRMGMRRFPRRTDGSCKKVSNPHAAFAIGTVHYDLVRRHRTLRITPAIAAKITDRPWWIPDLVPS